jgi:transglutaminase-like putative cysteine protease
MGSAMTHEVRAAALRVDVALDYALATPTTLLLCIEALTDAEQTVECELLTINGVEQAPAGTILAGNARYRWVRAAAGPLTIRYSADVTVQRPVVDIATLPATLFANLPIEIAPFLLASRYCDPARFDRVLTDDMNLPPGWVADGSTIALIRDWITNHLAYEPTSTVDTSATDTFVARAGICRDYAHLMIALARAAGVPARFVSAYAWQLDPPDFHAVAELWMAGRWHLIDATGLAPEASLIRIARTRDAIDASFMTIFGVADMVDQRIVVTAR